MPPSTAVTITNAMHLLCCNNMKPDHQYCLGRGLPKVSFIFVPKTTSLPMFRLRNFIARVFFSACLSHAPTSLAFVISYNYTPGYMRSNSHALCNGPFLLHPNRIRRLRGIKADPLFLTGRVTARHFVDMRQLNDTVVTIVGCASRVRVRRMVAPCTRQQTWEDKTDHRAHRRYTCAHDTDVQLGGRPGRGVDIIVGKIGRHARDIKGMESQDRSNAATTVSQCQPNQQNRPQESLTIRPERIPQSS